jgi:hypothetical protein
MVVLHLNTREFEDRSKIANSRVTIINLKNYNSCLTADQLTLL